MKVLKNKMKYPMTITEYHDDYNDRICAQKIEWNYDNFKGRFRVCDLCECPEDAIIGRDLFTAYDFIEAIKFGIDLAHKGYTGLELTEEIVEPSDD